MAKFLMWIGRLFFAGLTLFLGGVLGVFIFCNFSQFITHKNFLEFLTGAEAILSVYPVKKPVSPEDMASIAKLIKAGDVLTQDQLLSVLSGFYNTIINTLVVVISILGIFAYFSIRTLSKKDAENIVEEEVYKVVNKKLSDDDYVKSLLVKSEEVRALIEEITNRSNIQTEVTEKVNKLADRLASLEYWLMSNNESPAILKEDTEKDQ